MICIQISAPLYTDALSPYVSISNLTYYRLVVCGTRIVRDTPVFTQTLHVNDRDTSFQTWNQYVAVPCMIYIESKMKCTSYILLLMGSNTPIYYFDLVGRFLKLSNTFVWAIPGMSCYVNVIGFVCVSVCK